MTAASPFTPAEDADFARKTDEAVRQILDTIHGIDIDVAGVALTSILAQTICITAEDEADGLDIVETVLSDIRGRLILHFAPETRQ